METCKRAETQIFRQTCKTLPIADRAAAALAVCFLGATFFLRDKLLEQGEHRRALAQPPSQLGTELHKRTVSGRATTGCLGQGTTLWVQKTGIAWGAVRSSPAFLPQ